MTLIQKAAFACALSVITVNAVEAGTAGPRCSSVFLSSGLPSVSTRSILDSDFLDQFFMGNSLHSDSFKISPDGETVIGLLKNQNSVNILKSTKMIGIFTVDGHEVKTIPWNGEFIATELAKSYAQASTKPGDKAWVDRLDLSVSEISIHQLIEGGTKAVVLLKSEYYASGSPQLPDILGYAVVNLKSGNFEKVQYEPMARNDQILFDNRGHIDVRSGYRAEMSPDQLANVIDLISKEATAEESHRQIMKLEQKSFSNDGKVILATRDWESMDPLRTDLSEYFIYSPESRSVTRGKPSKALRSAVLSPSGRIIAEVPRLGLAVRLLDSKTMEQIQSIAFEGLIKKVEFSDDGSTMMVTIGTPGESTRLDEKHILKLGAFNL